MPATVTHAFFSLDVYKRLDNNDKLISDKDLNKLKMFSQSTDSMMFYNIESLKKGKELRKFQKYFHSYKSRDFFVKLCKEIKNMHMENNSEVISFLYGFICHYVLDSNIHPFVYYKTGFMDKDRRETYKYNNLHTFMETCIDNEMIIKKTNSKPYSFRLDKFCFDTHSFSSNLNTIIDNTFKEVFNIDNMSKIYYRSLKQMKSFLRKYRYDYFGLKNSGYKIIDTFTNNSTFKFQSLSYHYNFSYKDYFLNNNHSVWYNPVDVSISSHDSFIQLYEKSIKEAVNIIREVNYFFLGKDINLENVFTNKSYITGIDCDIPINFKKFAF